MIDSTNPKYVTFTQLLTGKPFCLQVSQVLCLLEITNGELQRKCKEYYKDSLALIDVKVYKLYIGSMNDDPTYVYGTRADMLIQAGLFYQPE